MRQVLALAALAVSLGACLAPPSQASRASDAARDLNLAARFGRMDIASELAANGAREAFLQRRAGWGRGVRVLDVEMAGLSMADEHHATVQVDIAWVRADEEQLRSTRIAQNWSDKDGGWQLVREKRMSGDVGLFGEPVTVITPERRDVHFEAKSLGTTPGE